MSNDEININSEGGNLNIAGSAVGGQGNTVTISGVLSIGTSPNRNELLVALHQLRAEIDKSTDLPADQADDIKADAEAAIKAVGRDKPNKERTIEKLTNMQKILDGLKGSVGSALALGELVGKVLLAAKGLQL